MAKKFSVIGIKFDESAKTYNYRAPASVKLKAGDTVIVDTIYHSNVAVKVDYVINNPTKDNVASKGKWNLNNFRWIKGVVKMIKY